MVQRAMPNASALGLSISPSSEERKAHHTSTSPANTAPSKCIQSENLNQDSPPRYTQDCDFFIHVRPLYLRAENTLFCAPRHYFQASEVFDGMFTLPDVPNTAQEGSSEAYPLFLESIKAHELKNFLRVLCSRLATSDVVAIRQIPNSWVPVLKLASLWQFTSIREKALRYLESSDCMLRLEISRQYGVEEWFVPALKDLINREQHLIADEIKQLGLEFAVKVMAFLDKAHRGHGPILPGLSPPSSIISDNEISRTFKGKWGTSA
ncbi:hypothetical protein V8D89_012649 [Ganoderma adspersum]